MRPPAVLKLSLSVDDWLILAALCCKTRRSLLCEGSSHYIFDWTRRDATRLDSSSFAFAFATQWVSSWVWSQRITSLAVRLAMRANIQRTVHSQSTHYFYDLYSNAILLYMQYITNNHSDTYTRMCCVRLADVSEVHENIKFCRSLQVLALSANPLGKYAGPRPLLFSSLPLSSPLSSPFLFSLVHFLLQFALLQNGSARLTCGRAVTVPEYCI